MRRGRIIVAFLFALLALALGLAWSERRPIARHFVDRELAKAGVPARYRIARLGVYSQRLEDVRLGDPAAPDLVAKVVELRLGYGMGGPSLRAVSAEGVRLHGRIVEGKLSLGTIDRLHPAPGNAPFALPDLDATLRDARMQIDTAFGTVALTLEGSGNLVNGFRGTLGADAPVLTAGGCRAAGIRGRVDVSVRGRRPSLRGPVEAASLACGGVAAGGLRLMPDLALAEALDRWTGTLGFGVAHASGGGAHVTALAGEASVDGSAAAMRGRLRATTAALAMPGVAAADGSADLRYALELAGGERRIEGRVSTHGVALDAGRLRPVLAALDVTAATPVAPIADAVRRASVAAVQRFAASADLALLQRGGRSALRLRRIDATSASGARLTASGGEGVGIRWPDGAIGVDGQIALSGGGFPALRVALSQPNIAAPAHGVIMVDPIAAGGATLALDSIRLEPAGGATRVATRVTVSGPLADGRVAGLTLPLDGRVGGGRFALNQECAALGFAALELAGMRLGAHRLTLCPSGSALVSSDGFGARVPAPRLTGRIGSAPLTLTAGEVRVGSAGLQVAGLDTRIGSQSGAETRLAAERLDGRFARGAVAGTFAGFVGSIANVPLDASDGAGEWRFANGVLDLNGGIAVADADPMPRFNPLRASAMALRLKDGVITASGTLVEPKTTAKVTDVTITHRLADGSGRAELAVPGITFTEALQPEALTRLTLGVVANVRGTMTGKGWIAWGQSGVTSGGAFRSDGLDLAAAFGPVAGIKGEIAFSDLLGFVTPPGQVATIASINPGIAVTDGVVRYRLLPGFQVGVEGGRWPFSGGELVLDSTTLDFAETAERHLTLRVTGMDAAEFVEQFGFQNIAVTGTFDGTVPMVFDKSGGRIENGRLAVRESGGTLGYVGPVSNAQLGTFGKLAFDALKSMRYNRLVIELDGSLDGEIVSRVLFDGTNQAPVGAAPKQASFLSRVTGLSKLTGLPFRFAITIHAPFRGLLNSAEALNDPRGLIGRTLPQPKAPLPGSAPVQPKESEVVR